MANKTINLGASDNIVDVNVSGGIDAQSININNSTGTATSATTTSPYKPVTWKFNAGITAADGMVVSVTTLNAGHTNGVFLSVDNGTHYYPISVSGTTALDTQFITGTQLLLGFDTDGSTESIYPVAGGTTRETITGGAWKVLNYYNSTNDVVLEDRINIQVKEDKKQKITLDELLTWLMDPAGGNKIPSNVYSCVVFKTNFVYNSNDILQLSTKNNKNYEIHLAGAEFTYVGKTTAYNTGNFSLMIKAAPQSSFTLTDGYKKGNNGIFLYRCTGDSSSYDPNWIRIDEDTIYSNFVKSGSTAAAGLVPAPDTTAGTTKFLCEDATWKVPNYTTNTDRYVNTAAFADDSAATAASPVKMTLTRAGSDTATVTGNIPKVSSSSAGVAPKGATVSTQSQTTKFLREDGTWAAPSYTTNTNTTYTLTQDATDGHKLTFTPSSGTATTITIPDEDTTYSNFVKSGSTAAAGLVPKPSTTEGTAKFLCEDATWTIPYNYNGVGYCTTGASTAAKFIRCGYFKLYTYSTVLFRLATSNTAKSQLTLNVASSGAKPLYINGTITSETNYTMPAGYYWAEYNSTNDYWNIRKVELTDTTYSTFVKSGTGTAAGLVPKPSTTEGTTKFLCEDATWKVPDYTTNTDRYVNTAAFADDSTATADSPVKMTLTRAGSDTATVTGNIPKVSSSSAGVAPKGTAVTTQSQTTKFLREDGTWAAPSYTTNTNTRNTVGATTTTGDLMFVGVKSSGTYTQSYLMDSSFKYDTSNQTLSIIKDGVGQVDITPTEIRLDGTSVSGGVNLALNSTSFTYKQGTFNASTTEETTFEVKCPSINDTTRVIISFFTMAGNNAKGPVIDPFTFMMEVDANASASTRARTGVATIRTNTTGTTTGAVSIARSYDTSGNITIYMPALSATAEIRWKALWLPRNY